MIVEGITGTLTYHSGYNYGASLQAYALQKAIEKLGGKNEIINFEPWKFFYSREMITKHPQSKKDYIKIFTRLPYKKELRIRQNLFDEFTNNKLKTTKTCRSKDDVLAFIDKYSCIICGSDQIWNLGIKHDKHAINMLYFLNFPKRQKRVSYAASFGSWAEHVDGSIVNIIPLLRQFDVISVREESGKDLLQKIGLNARVDIDPTLLLNANEYTDIARYPDEELPEKYVLLFSYTLGKNIIESAKAVSRYMNLPVINITPPPRALFSGLSRFLPAGPQEFLEIIKRASFVVTDSLHGTAFSRIYKKNFAAVYKSVPDTRIANIINKLGLQRFLVTKESINGAFILEGEDYDYSRSDILLNELREHSNRYILENIVAM